MLFNTFSKLMLVLPFATIDKVFCFATFPIVLKFEVVSFI